MLHERGFKKPWFRIVEVVEPTGRTMADIAAEIAAKRLVPLKDMRGSSRRHEISRARWAAYRQIKLERPDLTSTQVAMYFNRDASSVRHAWRAMEARK